MIVSHLATLELKGKAAMPIEIFHTESGGTETSLQVNDDGTVTFHKENSGRVMRRKGLQPRDQKMTAEEAKPRWSSYAEKIDEALAQLTNRNAGPSN